MKFYYTARSPYARKCLIIAHELNVADKLELILVDLKNKPQELTEHNPLGKIPCLIVNRKGIFDSVAIADFINNLGNKKVENNTQTKTLEALGDGISDAGIAIMFEEMREDKKITANIDKNKNVISNCLKFLEENIDLLNGVNIGTAAIFSAIGYLNFRFSNFGWQEKCPKLNVWFLDFAKKESAILTEPKA